MDERMKELVAVGASAAVNCRPCLDHHVPLCREKGGTEEDIRQAIETGLTVNRGAAARTREYVDAILSREPEVAAASGCC